MLAKLIFYFFSLLTQFNLHPPLREQSVQIASLPIFNIVLFAGKCTLKNVNYTAVDTYVGYGRNIKYILNKVGEGAVADYSDKKEVARLLRKAVNNGDKPEIVAAHIASVQRNMVLLHA